MRQKIELSSSWTLRSAREGWEVPATVPGTVQTDLIAAGRLPDPFYRTNEVLFQALDREDWIYETTVDTSLVPETKDGVRRLDLVFDGLDTFASIWISATDGTWSFLGEAYNMHRSWRFALNETPRGRLRLQVRFESPTVVGLKALEGQGFDLPANNDQSQIGGLDDRRISPFLRKAGYHFGWDWGPRFVTIGIWRPVYLEAWTARVSSFWVRTLALDPETSERTSRFAELEAQGEVDVREAGVYRLTWSCPDIEWRHIAEYPLEPGIHKLEQKFSMADPHLWWCSGQGESRLYTATLEIASTRTALDKTWTRFGVRTIELIRDDDRWGTGFHFRLNGRDVFMKGANWIPNDSFLPRATPERRRKILQAASDVGATMLRVWGGGVFEEDDFYEYCDEHGILVWQDFLFACSMYPGDDAFVASVKAEAEDNVRRLRPHPCLALWCGNNEIDVAWMKGEEGKGWGWKETYSVDQRKVMEAAYERLFEKVLPEIVSREHPGASYWPSSPQASLSRHSTIDSDSGDVHYWGVWHSGEPFERYDEVLPRFMSEFGFQSFPDPWAVRAFARPEDFSIDSEVMKAHQRSAPGNALIRRYMTDRAAVPQNFDHFLLASQLLQAEGIERAILAHRRARPRTMGTLYWQINDCWPAASWSSLDWMGRWKLLHHAVKRTFSPFALSCVEEGPDLVVYAVDDVPRPRSFVLEIMGETAANEVTEMGRSFVPNLHRRALGVRRLDGNESKEVLRLSDVRKSLGEVASRSWLAFRAFEAATGLEIARCVHFFVLPKNLDLPPPRLQTTWTKRPWGWEVAIESATLTRGVTLWTLVSGKVKYEDNGFVMLPGEKREIKVEVDGKGLTPEDFHVETWEEIYETGNLDR